MKETYLLSLRTTDGSKLKVSKGYTIENGFRRKREKNRKKKQRKLKISSSVC
jgi:hypothetical protein